MDIAEIKKLARKAREFTVEIGAHGFICVMPTDLEMRIIYAAQVTQEESTQSVVWKTLTGWTGVLVRHILPDAPEAVAANFVEFDGDVAREFFASRGEMFYQLGGEIFQRITARRSQIEAAEKN